MRSTSPLPSGSSALKARTARLRGSPRRWRRASSSRSVTSPRDLSSSSIHTRSHAAHSPPAKRSRAAFSSAAICFARGLEKIHAAAFSLRSLRISSSSRTLVRSISSAFARASFSACSRWNLSRTLFAFSSSSVAFGLVQYAQHRRETLSLPLPVHLTMRGIQKLSVGVLGAGTPGTTRSLPPSCGCSSYRTAACDTDSPWSINLICAFLTRGTVAFRSQIRHVP
mmetsp:Transcript_10106/g.33159  ORF Transcript_10106/g.33159 Transcript_10106/m.33159 type:complete len:225 (+) Transcript_10106:201-875(+)